MALPTIVFPAIVLAFCFFPDEKKQQVVSNKTLVIVLYVIFISWAAFAVIYILQWLSILGDTFDVISLLLFVSFAVNCLGGAVYMHVYRSGVENNGSAPLLDTQA